MEKKLFQKKKKKKEKKKKMEMKLIILHCVTDRKNYLFHFYFFLNIFKKIKEK